MLLQFLALYYLFPFFQNPHLLAFYAVWITIKVKNKPIPDFGLFIKNVWSSMSCVCLTLDTLRDYGVLEKLWKMLYSTKKFQQISIIYFGKKPSVTKFSCFFYLFEVTIMNMALTFSLWCSPHTLSWLVTFEGHKLFLNNWNT